MNETERALINAREMWREKARLRDEALAESRMRLAERGIYIGALHRENEDLKKELNAFKVTGEDWKCLQRDNEKLLTENADLKARVEELKTSLLNASADVPDMVKGIQYEKVSNMPTLGASTRLRDKHYRECEETIRAEAKEVVLDRDTVLHLLSAISRARGQK